MWISSAVVSQSVSQIGDTGLPCACRRRSHTAESDVDDLHDDDNYGDSERGSWIRTFQVRTSSFCSPTAAAAVGTSSPLYLHLRLLRLVKRCFLVVFLRFFSSCFVKKICDQTLKRAPISPKLMLDSHQRGSRSLIIAHTDTYNN